jgi:hypothetical protein
MTLVFSFCFYSSLLSPYSFIFSCSLSLSLLISGLDISSLILFLFVSSFSLYLHSLSFSLILSSLYLHSVVLCFIVRFAFLSCTYFLSSFSLYFSFLTSTLLRPLSLSFRLPLVRLQLETRQTPNPAILMKSGVVASPIGASRSVYQMEEWVSWRDGWPEARYMA